MQEFIDVGPCFVFATQKQGGGVAFVTRLKYFLCKDIRCIFTKIHPCFFQQPSFGILYSFVYAAFLVFKSQCLKGRRFWIEIVLGTPGKRRRERRVCHSSLIQQLHKTPSGLRGTSREISLRNSHEFNEILTKSE